MAGYGAGSECSSDLFHDEQHGGGQHGGGHHGPPRFDDESGYGEHNTGYGAGGGMAGEASAGAGDYEGVCQPRESPPGGGVPSHEEVVCKANPSVYLTERGAGDPSVYLTERGAGGGGGVPSHKEVFKIVCKANPSFYLTDRGGELVLAHGNESNSNQQWYKDMKHSSKKDNEGFPGFALINKGSVLALYHDDKKDWIGTYQRFRSVSLKPYDGNDSFVWSQSADVGHGYQCIRPFTDVHLNLDAYRGDKEHGGVKDGTEIILHKWNKQENQKWKILPISKQHSIHRRRSHQSFGQETVKLSCEAKPEYYVTVRGDSVVLAASDDSDPRQEWIKDSKLAANMKDESGSPAFVLINKATQKALQHGNTEFDRVGVVPLHGGDRADESVLWTLSADVGKGYRCLRPVGDINLSLDASHGDKKHGGVHDGTELILFTWTKRENQKWRITVL